MDDWFHSMAMKMIYGRWNGKRVMTVEDKRTLGGTLLDKVEQIYGVGSPLYDETCQFIESCVRGNPGVERLTALRAAEEASVRIRR